MPYPFQTESSLHSQLQRFSITVLIGRSQFLDFASMATLSRRSKWHFPNLDSFSNARHYHGYHAYSSVSYRVMEVHLLLSHRRLRLLSHKLYSNRRDY